MGDRAATLRKVGEKLQGQHQQNSSKSGIYYYSMSQVRFRNMVAKYKQMVTLLEEDHSRLKKAYEKRGANPLIAYFKLSVGVICVALSIIWMFQIIWAVLIRGLSKSPASNYLLSNLLELCLKSKVLVPDLLVYMALCSYLLFAAVVGILKVSVRVRTLIYRGFNL